jgi:hypothetical protein
MAKAPISLAGLYGIAAGAFAVMCHCAFGQVTAGSAPDDHAPSYAAAQKTRIAIVKYLLPILKSDGLGARLDFQAVCQFNTPLLFPPMNVRVPSPGSSSLTAIKEIFSNDARVKVGTEHPGLVTISVGKMPSELLQTKIDKLNFSALEQYNPKYAIMTIQQSK